VSNASQSDLTANYCSPLEFWNDALRPWGAAVCALFREPETGSQETLFYPLMPGRRNPSRARSRRLEHLLHSRYCLSN